MRKTKSKNLQTYPPYAANKHSNSMHTTTASMHTHAHRHTATYTQQAQAYAHNQTHTRQHPHTHQNQAHTPAIHKGILRTHSRHTDIREPTNAHKYTKPYSIMQHGQEQGTHHSYWYW